MQVRSEGSGRKQQRRSLLRALLSGGASLRAIVPFRGTIRAYARPFGLVRRE